MRPARRVLQRADLILGFVECFEDLAAAVVVQLARLGCHHRTRRAMQQARAEALFELADLLADGGRREAH